SRAGKQLGQPCLCSRDLRASDFALREQLGLVEVRELSAGGDLIALADSDGLEASRSLKAQLGLRRFDGARGDDGGRIAVGSGGSAVDGERADGRKDDA